VAIEIYDYLNSFHAACDDTSCTVLYEGLRLPRAKDNHTEECYKYTQNLATEKETDWTMTASLGESCEAIAKIVLDIALQGLWKWFVVPLLSIYHEKMTEKILLMSPLASARTKDPQGTQLPTHRYHRGLPLAGPPIRITPPRKQTANPRLCPNLPSTSYYFPIPPISNFEPTNPMKSTPWTQGMYQNPMLEERDGLQNTKTVEHQNLNPDWNEPYLQNCTRRMKGQT